MKMVSHASRAEEGREALKLRIHGSAELPTVIYLPGSHGDWSVIAGFRQLLLPHVRFVEFTYPRTCSWTVEDYSWEVALALRNAGIKAGWLLGESFGSQVAWALTKAQDFQCLGIILCGGFIQHPFPTGAALFRTLCGILLGQQDRINRLTEFYGGRVRTHYENTPEQAPSIKEFQSRRTVLDGRAALHRLQLIQHNDPRGVAKAFGQPVYYLGGFWDPLVPWYLVWPWLKCWCPGYAGGRVILGGDHNILFSAPSKSAQAVVKWLGRDEKELA
jgi:pimeloyl-ACP methyl ester carboxylesterase